MNKYSCLKNMNITFYGKLTDIKNINGKIKLLVESDYGVTLIKKYCPPGKLPIYNDKIVIATNYPITTLNEFFNIDVDIVASKVNLYTDRVVSGSYLKLLSISNHIEYK